MKDMRKKLCQLILNEEKQVKSCDTSSTITKVLLVLGFATTIITTALCIYSYLENRAYRKRWEEYDDCGI